LIRANAREKSGELKSNRTVQAGHAARTEFKTIAARPNPAHTGAARIDKEKDMTKNNTMPVAEKVLAVLFAAAALILLASGPCRAQDQQQQPAANTSEEYLRIEASYTSVVKYYNNDLDDENARYIARCVLYYSTYYKLDPRLIVAVIAVESAFKPRAVSSKGAQGLGQLMPGTAAYLGVNNAFDVQQNVNGTVKYLREQYERWQSSPYVFDFMLAAYNAGPEAVAKYNGVPPYTETQNYVVKVKKLYRYFIYGEQ
jgi:soluble lytic murein transglycosylase-like protein